MTAPDALLGLIRNPSVRTDRIYGVGLPCFTLGCMGEDACTYCGSDMRTRAHDTAGDTTRAPMDDSTL